ncbi:aminoacyl-tRNA deacylase [Paenibacillus sp. GCM10027626]|uniref:aminoacyl-tRNA deacylase n=1 Tax=Paenibacillus sp. GCM10027626 TaxID=3273411 RepID=UPI00363FA50C
MDLLKTILLEKDIPFEIIHHEKPIRTAQEGADYFGIELGQTAPTLIVKADEGYFAIIISGQRKRVNLEETAEILGCSQLTMASPKEVRQVTGYAIGSVALAVSLPCIVDRALYSYPFIYGGTGEAASTLKISPDALEKLNQVVAYLD